LSAGAADAARQPFATTTMRRSARLLSPLSLLAPLVAVVGCSSRDAAHTDTTLSMGEAVTPASGTPGAGQDTAAGVASDSARMGAAPAPGVADNAPSLWLVSSRGIGPVSAGMRFSVAAPLLGVPASAGTGNQVCAYVRPAHGPAGVSLMVRGGEVARVQVDSGDVRTTEGARIGDSEARIDSLYAGRVTSAPHKYTSGHYLTVKPAGGESPYRLVFETDGKRVTRYRAGRLPEVEWVEGCS
jgi:hypothetical protein